MEMDWFSVVTGLWHWSVGFILLGLIAWARHHAAKKNYDTSFGMPSIIFIIMIIGGLSFLGLAIFAFLQPDEPLYSFAIKFFTGAFIFNLFVLILISYKWTFTEDKFTVSLFGWVRKEIDPKQIATTKRAMLDCTLMLYDEKGKKIFTVPKYIIEIPQCLELVRKHSPIEIADFNPNF